MPGQRTEDGQIEAAALLTFDQFQEDQILAMEYNHHGDGKRNGIRILDPPDKMSDRVLQYYREGGSNHRAMNTSRWTKGHDTRPKRDCVVKGSVYGANQKSKHVPTSFWDAHAAPTVPPLACEGGSTSVDSRRSEPAAVCPTNRSLELIELRVGVLPLSVRGTAVIGRCTTPNVPPFCRRALLPGRYRSKWAHSNSASRLA